MNYFNDTLRDAGMLVLRFGIGFMIMLHGYPKITGGPETWAFLGSTMANIGITFWPVFWGFMAAVTEFFGGIFLMLGLLHRLSAALLTFTMFVAAMMHYSNGDPFMQPGGPDIAYAVELGIVFLAMALLGPGKYALDNLIFKKK